MAWTDETWEYVNLGIPDSRILWKYQEAYTKNGLSGDAGFVALALSCLYPREFPVKKLIGWCGRSRVRFMKALKELEGAGWIEVTSKRWRQIRNLKLK